MSPKNRLNCPTCHEGRLRQRHESYPVRVGKNATLPSAPVSFLACDTCDATIFLGKASEEAHHSAAVLCLERVLRGEDALLGEVLPHLRAVTGLNAKALSLALGLEESAVATWERRNTKIARPTAFMVAALLYRRLCGDAGDFLEKVREPFLAAVDAPTPSKRRRKPKNAA
jgi:hypothetical protein